MVAGVSEVFVPLLVPPADAGEGVDGLWFAVHGNRVVIVEAAHADQLDFEASTAPQFLGTLDGAPCWTVDVADASADGAFLDLFSLYGRVTDRRWFVAGRAVQLVEWERTHRFCGRCGTPTEPAPADRAKRCPACGLLAFPRLAPAVIVLVHRGDELLLARGRAFGAVAMYSTLAGFVEPGETIEEAVHREVFEEVGITLASVRYVASQPWPFPHSLMLGFYAEYGSGDIVLQESEIVDAQWFTADALPNIPPGLSIARKLIDGFLAGAR
jgi:NAD+ diphosphatase